MRIYRMHRLARAASNCTGAMEAGGRWNPIGTPMLYAAEHLSLACVEVLVHLDKTELPRNYAWSYLSLNVRPGVLNHRDVYHVSSCQAAGQNWIDSCLELATLVPSVIIPEEFNILLNPGHPEYASLLWSEPQPFRFDPRLFYAEPRIL